MRWLHSSWVENTSGVGSFGRVFFEGSPVAWLFDQCVCERLSYLQCGQKEALRQGRVECFEATVWEGLWVCLHGRVYSPDMKFCACSKEHISDSSGCVKFVCGTLRLLLQRTLCMYCNKTNCSCSLGCTVPSTFPTGRQPLHGFSGMWRGNASVVLGLKWYYCLLPQHAVYRCTTWCQACKQSLRKNRKILEKTKRIQEVLCKISSCFCGGCASPGVQSTQGLFPGC